MTAPTDSPPPIWNPNVIALWSVFLSPIFGAYIYARNWDILGEPERARASLCWSFAGLAGFTALYVLLPDLGDGRAHETIKTFRYGYLVLWYFGSAYAQVKFVRHNLGVDYPRRPWAQAVSAGFIALALYFGLLWQILEMIR